MLNSSIDRVQNDDRIDENLQVKLTLTESCDLTNDCRYGCRRCVVTLWYNVMENEIYLTHVQKIKLLLFVKMRKYIVGRSDFGSSSIVDVMLIYGIMEKQIYYVWDYNVKSYYRAYYYFFVFNLILSFIIL